MTRRTLEFSGRVGIYYKLERWVGRNIGGIKGGISNSKTKEEAGKEG